MFWENFWVTFLSYLIATQSCLKILKHGQSKVLNAQLHKGVIVVGCQYGLIVLWDLEEVLSSPYLALDINRELERSLKSW